MEFLVNARRVTIFGAAVTAVVGAGFAVANAMNAGEPYWIASRSFVRMTVQSATSDIKNSTTQLKFQVLQGRLESIRAKISDRELLLNKQEGPEEYKRLIRAQVEEFKEQQKRISAELESLRAQLSNR